MLSDAMPVLLRCLACFFLGSIPFAVLAMSGSGVDIRQVGSGNPGFNNVLRVSKGRAVIALIGDVGKGYLAVWLMLRVWPAPDAWHLGTTALGWLFGFVTVLGHCYSPFLKFNGGKGVATSAGVMLVLYPAWALVALVYFAVFRIAAGKLKWPEAGASASLSTWVLFVMLMFLMRGPTDAAFALVMMLFLFWRHRSNLRRLVVGT
jgi:acyl phosphate:glycerol-3-phosphate acyltransferase